MSQAEKAAKGKQVAALVARHRTDVAEPLNFTVKYVCFAGSTVMRNVTEGWSVGQPLRQLAAFWHGDRHVPSLAEAGSIPMALRT